MAFRVEIDEEVDIFLPPLVDDDGDTVVASSVVWTSSDPSIGTVHPAADGLTAIARTTGVIGVTTYQAEVFNSDGASGKYTGEVSFGTGVAVGGEVLFGTPRKVTTP